jgi:thiamine-phosphate pyrophosphorylase
MSEPRASFEGLHVLADDDSRWRENPVGQAEAACRGGADVVQLRVKHASDAQAFDWAQEIRRLTRQHGVRFVVNDRFDIALASEADAVHLGQDDIPPAEIPASVRKALAVGRSTHTLDEATRARDENIDYVAFGPIFGTDSKNSAYGERGLSLLSKVAERVGSLPLIAIGGIRAENIADVFAAGATGAAVISAIADAGDPSAATRALVDRITRARAAEEANDGG